MLNPTGFTRVNEEGLLLGKVTEAEMVSPKEQQAESSQLIGEEGAMECHESYVKTWSNKRAANAADWRIRLEYKVLCGLIADHHHAFSLDPEDRGLTVDTDDASLRSQPPQRMPFALRQDIARQLQGHARLWSSANIKQSVVEDGI